MAKTVLTGTLTLHFDTSGNDTTGDGLTVGTAFRTPAGAYEHLRANYDLDGFNVRIIADGAGTYTCDLAVGGRCVGETGLPEQIKIIGLEGITDITTQVSPYLWSPTVNKSAITLSGDASLYVEGFYTDHTAAYNSGGIDGVRISFNVGEGGRLRAKNLGFGLNSYRAGAFNAQNLSSIQYFGDMFISGPTRAVTASALSTASTTIALSALGAGSLPVMKGAGVLGTGIGENCYVTDTDGSTYIVVSPAPIANAGSTSLTLTNAFSTIFGVGQKSLMMNANFNAAGGGVTYIGANPHFLFGFLNVDEHSSVNWGSLFIRHSTRQQPTATGTGGTNSIVVSSAAGLSVGWYAHHASIPAGTTIANIAGTTITLSANLTADIAAASMIFGEKPSVVGPKLTAWGNSFVKAPLNDSAHMPGTDWYYADDRTAGAVAQGSEVSGPPLHNTYGFVTGRYYTGEIVNPVSGKTLTLEADKLYPMPFGRPDKRGTFTKIGIEVITAAAAGKLARLGIFSALPATSMPGLLVVDAGTVAVDTVGLKEITISQALNPDLEYWFGIVSDGTPTIRAG